jgi:hypothetical protein
MGGAREFIRETEGLFEDSELVAMYLVHEKDRQILKDFRSRFDSGSRRLTWTQISRALRSEPLKCRVEAVLEPLKVRLITKSEAYPYWVARFWQRILWEFLQEFKCFKLTGRPVDESIVTDWFSDSCAVFSYEKGFIVSGDYSAATDGLSSWVTKSIFETLLESLHMVRGLESLETYVAVRDILRSTLYPHLIHYPEKFVEKNPELDPFLQKNGQLMGSILSFPVLCLANLAAYWVSFRTYFSKVDNSFQQMDPFGSPVLINGDDILFWCPDSMFFRLWKSLADFIGFKLSLGKNYRHRRFFMISSELFELKPTQSSKRPVVSRVPYLNVGLLTSVSKLQHTQDTVPIWDNFNYLIKRTRNPDRLWRRFIHYNKPLIQKLTMMSKKHTLALTLPRSLGGLGFDFPVGKLTYFQSCLARFLSEKVHTLLEQLPSMVSLQSTTADVFEVWHGFPTLYPAYGPLEKDVEPKESELHFIAPLLRDYPENDLTYKFNFKLLKEFLQWMRKHPKVVPLRFVRSCLFVICIVSWPKESRVKELRRGVRRRGFGVKEPKRGLDISSSLKFRAKWILLS